jgi:hydrogenase nickel incorporation protein HypB
MGRVHVHADGKAHGHRHEHDDDDADHDSDGTHRDVGDHSGYAATGTVRVEVLERILSENDRVAAVNRRDFTSAGLVSVNLMSSPGAGKTTLLKRTLAEIGGIRRVGILEGDIATSLDADKLADCGAAAVSLVNTSAGFGGECHLDAVMVRSGLSRLPLPELDLLIVENVGNLVCPAEFDVGEHAKAMVYAITEGEEKPLKYPVMFRAVDAVVVNKMDLLPHLDFDLDLFLANLRAVNPAATVIQVSARTGDGISEWSNWLLGQAPTAPPAASPLSPAAGPRPDGWPPRPHGPAASRPRGARCAGAPRPGARLRAGHAACRRSCGPSGCRSPGRGPAGS